VTHQGVVTKGICPSAFGAKDWELSSFSRSTRLFYFGTTNFCMNYEPLEVYYIAGTPFVGSNLQVYPGPGGNMGEFVAYDPVAGERVWTIKEPLAIFGGALSTATNLVFYGTLDKLFKAVDAKTGDLLFSTTLECGIASPPITYLGPDGKQRIAITTGLGRIQGGIAGGACPAGSAFGDDGAAGQGAAVNGPQADAAAKFAASQKQFAAAGVAPTSGYVHVFKLP
jgi:alcohol dehydrogenase (cytochrome c)